MKAFLYAGTALNLIGASLWIFASFQKVPHDPHERDEAGMHPYAIVDRRGSNEIDVLKTAERQTFWNGWAALATGLAGLANVAALFL